jgi:hypothetical protein
VIKKDQRKRKRREVRGENESCDIVNAYLARSGDSLLFSSIRLGSIQILLTTVLVERISTEHDWSGQRKI